MRWLVEKALGRAFIVVSVLALAAGLGGRA